MLGKVTSDEHVNVLERYCKGKHLSKGSLSNPVFAGQHRFLFLFLFFDSLFTSQYTSRSSNVVLYLL